MLSLILARPLVNGTIYDHSTATGSLFTAAATGAAGAAGSVRLIAHSADLNLDLLASVDLSTRSL